MKILLTHRYFAPDSSPYGTILRQISEDVTVAGHEVHVFSSRPSYGHTQVAAPSSERSGLKCSPSQLNVAAASVRQNSGGKGWAGGLSPESSAVLADRMRVPGHQF